MSAGTNSTNYFIWFSSSKNEHNVLRRLFYNFQQCVETLWSYHMSFIENKDFIAVSSWSKTRTLSKLSSVVNTVMACSIYFYNINRPRATSCQIFTALTFTTWVRSRTFFAINATCQNARRTGLTASARTRE